MNKRTKVFTALVVAFLCCLHSAATGKLYFSSDNFNISLVLNGYYGNPLSQYQHPLFCLIIYVLSVIFPFADSFMLVVHIGVFAECAILFYLLAEELMTRKISVWKIEDFLRFTLSLFSVIIFCTGFKVWYVNYTITTASFAFTGVITLTVGRIRHKGILWIVAGTVFIAFAFMLRKESALLFLPFIILIIMADILSSSDRKMELRSVLKYTIPACLTIILLLASQLIFNAIEPYASAKRYNDARTTIVDFPMKPMWEVTETDVFTKADYHAAQNWLFSDTEVMDTEMIESIAEAGRKSEYEYSMDGLQKALSDMLRVAGKTDVYISLMILLIVLIMIRNIISEKTIWCVIASVLAVSGAFIILLYYTIAGRAPLRVWEPVLFATLATELLIMIGGRSRLSDKLHLLFLLLILIISYYGIGQVIAHTEFHEPQLAINSRNNVNADPYEITIKDDDLYIWPNWHATIPEQAERTGKLPSRDVIDHNIALGDWTSGQPYYTAFLERIGHPNPIRDLVEKDNVCVMSDNGYILYFLREHYGDQIKLVEAGEVNGKTAYKTEKMNVLDAQGDSK